MNPDKYLVVIAGPTAVGKTSLSISLAKRLNTVILSADSRQFYKEIPIGTAQPSASELKKIPHFFISSHSIHTPINASQFEKEALTLLESLFNQHSLIILCGGSGLYIDALCNGFDKEMPDANLKIRAELNDIYQNQGITALQELLLQKDPDFYRTVDLQNPKRLLRALEVCLVSGKPYSILRKGIPNTRPFKVIKIVIAEETEELYKKINNRTETMFQNGFLEEAQKVFAHKNLTPLKTVGYNELFLYFENIFSLEQAKEEIKKNTRRYARRQLTWFRRDKKYTWFKSNQFDEIVQFIRTQGHV
ncbi:MAG: tRNA (adenosine(37)-N6)-dimethylallyltransferase MiaA [Flavobacteriales bacterium]|nr:tRNA (adenosine(37)-N6)-dimethylallyltransferase MiaA [Flavobacteriales bacterium]